MGYVKTCRSHQSRTVFGNLRWGGPYLSNTENSRAVFSPSEILRGLSGAARDLPPVYAPRPPSPGVWPRAADAPPPCPRLRPARDGESAQTRSAPFPRRAPCSYVRGSSRGPARSLCATQIAASHFPRGVSPQTVPGVGRHARSSTSFLAVGRLGTGGPAPRHAGHGMGRDEEPWTRHRT